MSRAVSGSTANIEDIYICGKLRQKLVNLQMILEILIRKIGIYALAVHPVSQFEKVGNSLNVKLYDTPQISLDLRN